MKGIIDFFVSVKSELDKVTWPNRQEVIRLTLIVLIVTLAVGVYTSLLDFGFVKGLEAFITK